MSVSSHKIIIAIVVVLVAAISVNFCWWDNFDAELIRGKRVLITGSSSGIGEALAYQYSKWRASIVITARRETLLRKVAEKCKTLGAARIEYVVADMTKPSDREQIVRKTEQHLGGLDHLILNHADMKFIPWLQMSQNMTVVEELMEVNFISHVDIASKSLKMLRESQGNIAVTSTVLGKVPLWIATPYVASKFALHGFFGSLNQEFLSQNTNVSVSMVVMGYVATDAANTIKDTVFSRIPLYPSDLGDAVVAIIKGVTRRQHEIYNPFLQSWLAVTLHSLAPCYVEVVLSYVLPYLCHF